MLLSDSRGNYHLRKHCCGWHILCNLLSLRGALWRISLHLRGAVYNYAQFCKPSISDRLSPVSPAGIWLAQDSLSCCDGLAPACQGDVSRRDRGEEGMMYMLVFWDEIMSLGVVLGVFCTIHKD